MAVITTANASTLKIKFDCGMDGNGDNIMRTSSYEIGRASCRERV